MIATTIDDFRYCHFVVQKLGKLSAVMSPILKSDHSYEDIRCMSDGNKMSLHS